MVKSITDAEVYTSATIRLQVVNKPQRKEKPKVGWGTLGRGKL